MHIKDQEVNVGIHEVQQLTGISQATLRMWEKRYGWPTPPRDENGYRIFNKTLINDLKRVKNLLETGVPVGEVIKDGKLYFPVKLVPKKIKPKHDWSSLPSPKTIEGWELRAKMEEAIEIQNWGKVEEIKALALRLRASERPAILSLPLSINR